MRRFPLTYPREAYLYLRARVMEAHGMSIDNFMVREVKTAVSGLPISLSEFNIIGACLHHFHPDVMFFKEFDSSVRHGPIKQFPSTDFTVNGPSRLDSLTEEQDRQLCEYIGEQPGCTRG